MEAAAVLRWQRLLAQLIFSEPVTEIENCVYSAAGQRARLRGYDPAVVVQLGLRAGMAISTGSASMCQRIVVMTCNGHTPAAIRPPQAPVSNVGRPSIWLKRLLEVHGVPAGVFKVATVAADQAVTGGSTDGRLMLLRRMPAARPAPSSAWPSWWPASFW